MWGCVLLCGMCACMCVLYMYMYVCSVCYIFMCLVSVQYTVCACYMYICACFTLYGMCGVYMYMYVMCVVQVYDMRDVCIMYGCVQNIHGIYVAYGIYCVHMCSV